MDVLDQPRRGPVQFVHDWWGARRSGNRRAMVWLGRALIAVVLEFSAVSVVSSAATAFDLMVNIVSPMNNPDLTGPVRTGLGILLSLSGFLLLPAVVGLAVSAQFQASIDKDVRERVSKLEELNAKRAGSS